jgi:catechol 2,3-dioxygenase-like lactoylglutathione lyase family enzyme
MTFEEILDQAIAMLQRRGRVTYRALARQFNLDEHFRGGKSMLQCTGIDHVALVTHDMEATVQFYTRLLGMRLVRTMRTGPALNNARHYFFDAGRGNQLAFFDAADSPPSVIPQHLHHLALTVDSVADLQAIHQRLREHGVEVTDILERAYGSTFNLAFA